MQLDRPLAEFRLKSDSNCLLINFFDPIPVVGFTRQDNLIWIWTQNLIWNLNLIKNKSNFMENGWTQLDFWLNSTFLIQFNHFRLNSTNFWYKLNSISKSVSEFGFKICVLIRIQNLCPNSNWIVAKIDLDGWNRIEKVE